MSKALLIIDVQNDYFPGGALALNGMEQAAENCRLLLEAFRARGRAVIHVQHHAVHHGADYLVVGSAGCAIHESVAPVWGEGLIVKTAPNAFWGTWLWPMLHQQGLGELVICGAMTHLCIDSTVRAAFDLGLATTVAGDACATRDLEFDGVVITAAEVQASFLAALARPFAKIRSTGDLVGACRA